MLTYVIRWRDYYDINFILCFLLQVQRHGIIRNNGSLRLASSPAENNPPLLDDCNKRNRRPENNVSTKYHRSSFPPPSCCIRRFYARSFDDHFRSVFSFRATATERENFSWNSIFLFSVIVPLYLARSMLVFRIDSECRIWRASRERT